MPIWPTPFTFFIVGFLNFFQNFTAKLKYAILYGLENCNKLRLSYLHLLKRCNTSSNISTAETLISSISALTTSESLVAFFNVSMFF